MKKCVLFLLVLGVSFTLFACDSAEEADEPSITSISVNAEDIQDEFLLDEFYVSDVRLTITYDDGNSETIHLTEAMISREDIQSLNSPGTHTITVTYENHSTTFTITLIEDVDDLTGTLMAIYEMGVEAGEIPDSYEEWLETVRGPKGEDGRKVNFQVSDDYIQWQYDGEDTWTNLIELASLIGPQGEPGEDGADGHGVVMQVNEDHIQWKYEGDTEWKNLISLDLLMGSKGDEGQDGREVVLRVFDNHIQWQYEGDEEWTNLIEVASLAGWHVVRFIDEDGTVLDVQLIRGGDDAQEPDPPIRKGRTFTGWSENFTEITEDMDFVAQYDTLTYTVQFESNGGTAVDAMEGVEHGATVELPVPEKYRHGFIGWYLGEDANAGPFYDTSYVKGNITLYARWEYKAFKLDFVVLNQRYDGPYGQRLLPDETIVDVSLSNNHSGALTSLGRILMWGNNDSGQLGDGTTETRRTPVEITERFDLRAGETVIDISLHRARSIALTSDGRVFTWGTIWTLGDGSVAMRNVPVDITDQFDLADGEQIVVVSMGDGHASALTSDGRLFMWGWNYHGAIGDGTTQHRKTPVDITDQFAFGEDETIVDISMNGYNSSVLTSVGRLFTWGNNGIGQLGDGTTENRHVPTDITDQFGLTADETIIMHNLGQSHAGAWTSEGRLFMWGNNQHSQLGHGIGPARYEPFDISDYLPLDEEETLNDIALGSSTSTVLTSTGRVVLWGQRLIGDESGLTRDEIYPLEVTPALPVEDGSVITAISTGSEFRGGPISENMAFLTENGHLYMWGLNWHGQLGDGATGRSQHVIRTFAQMHSMHTAYYNHGDVVNVFEPHKDGHIISEWHLDPGLMTPFDFLERERMGQEDLTLYGRWLTEYKGILSACIRDTFCIIETDQGPIGLPDTYFFDFLLDIDIGDEVRVYGVLKPYRNMNYIPDPMVDSIISVNNPLPKPVCLDAVELDDFDALSRAFGHRVSLSGFLVMDVEERHLLGYLEDRDVLVRLLNPYTDQEITMIHSAFLTNDVMVDALLALEYGDMIDIHGPVLKWRDGQNTPYLYVTHETAIVESSSSYDFSPYLEVEGEDVIKVSLGIEHQIVWTVDDDRWPDVTFDSADEAVAIVDEHGLIIPVNPGRTTITVALTIDLSVYVTIVVAVYAPE